MSEAHTLSPLIEARLLEFAPRRDFVIDTGTLLIHALGAFESGKYLSLACGFVNERNREEASKRLFRTVDRLLSATKVSFITPHALTEFLALAERKIGLRQRDVAELFAFYREVLLRLSDVQLSKNSILEHEQVVQLGIADVSTILASDEKNAIIVTTDWKLREWCRKEDRPALHVYFDVDLLA